MDVKRYHKPAPLHYSPDCEMVEDDGGYYVRYDDIKHLLPRPDPAEVERLVDRLIGLIREEEYADSQGFFAKVTRLEEQIVKARADLLKLVGGDPDNDPIAKRVHDTFEKISQTNWGQLK